MGALFPLRERDSGMGVVGYMVREWVLFKTRRSLFRLQESPFRWGRLSIINGSTGDFSRNRSVLGGIVTFGKYANYRQCHYFPYERGIWGQL